MYQYSFKPKLLFLFLISQVLTKQSSTHASDDEIEEVVPIKSEPQEPSSRSDPRNMSNIVGNQEIFSSQTLATNADSVEYEENIYDEYYADDQYAAAAVEGCKGEQARNV